MVEKVWGGGEGLRGEKWGWCGRVVGKKWGEDRCLYWGERVGSGKMVVRGGGGEGGKG